MTFDNFCKWYILYLSYSEPRTLNLTKLGVEASVSTPRLREPVFCYAYALGRTPKLLAAVKDHDAELYVEYQKILENTDNNYKNFFDALAKVYDSGYFTNDLPYDGPEWLPKEYPKVYMAWQAHCGRREDMNASKNGNREFVLKIIKMYPELNFNKISRDLDLDLRNVRYFFKGENNRLSEENSGRIFYYIVEYDQAREKYTSEDKYQTL